MNILRLSTLSLITMMLIPIGAYAHCEGKHSGNHPHCRDGGGVDPDDAAYSVLITGDVMGNSLDEFPWSQGGGQKAVGGQQHNAGVLTDLSFFTALVNGPFTAIQGSACFGAYPFQLWGGFIKAGKKGTAKASFWFEANTHTEPAQTLFYSLQYTGDLPPGWLPEIGSPAILNMNHWTLGVPNVGEDIKAISCTGEGTANVTITVTNITPL